MANDNNELKQANEDAAKTQPTGEEAPKVDPGTIEEAGAEGEELRAGVEGEEKEGDTEKKDPPASGSAASGSASKGSAEFFATVPTRDQLFESGFQPISNETYESLAAGAGIAAIGLERGGSPTSPLVINKPADAQPSILINSSRVIINSKEGHTIVAGAKGVALTSREKVNIDADTSVTIFGNDGIYLGVPNKGIQPQAGGYPGEALEQKFKAKLFKDGKKLKSYPAPDSPYEPAVLGLKLTNWLDDLLTAIKNNVVLTPVGYAASREDSQWDFEALRTRLTEMLSTYIYVDGLSHEIPDWESLQEPPKEVTKPQTSITVNASVTVTGAGGPFTPPVPGPPSSPDAAKPGYTNGSSVTLPQVRA